MGVAIIIYALLALFYVQVVGKTSRERLLILIAGTAIGVLIKGINSTQLYYLLGSLYVLMAIVLLITRRKILPALAIGLLGVYVMSNNWAQAISAPIANFSRSLERGFFSNAIFQFADHLKVLIQPPPALLAIVLFLVGIIFLQSEKNRSIRLILGIIGLIIPCALSFMDLPFALVGGAYIIMAAYIVRSLPASVRAGVASLQQIDPSIEEASNILGADAQYTFRKVTLPLILPALFAGLIFSFTRHMTSLSAIIFLVNAKWRIVTASILSEWEQGGVSIAAAYSTVIIIFVMIAIAVLNLITKRLFKGREGVDLSQGF